MAERSIIDGFGPGVQKWASEETAKKIAETLESMKNLSAKQSREIVKTLEKSGGKLDTEALKDLNESLEDLEEAVDEQTEATETNTKSQSKASRASTIFKNTLLSAGSIIGAAMGSVFGQMISQANIVAELNRNGVQLSNSLDGTASGLSNFGLAAAEANLSFQELSDLTKKYGATINRYGIRAFAETSRSVTGNLETLGISAAESSELVAEYLKARRFMTYQETLTQQQQNQAAQTFIKQIDQYSMAFGESRTALLESVTGTLEQIDVQAFLKTQGPGVQAAFEDMAAQLAGSEFSGLRTSLTQAVADPITQRSQLFQDLIAAGQADAANALLDFSQAARSGNQALSNMRFEEFMTSLENANIDYSQRIGEAGQALRDFSNQAKIRADLIARGNDFERDSAARINDMQNAFRNISMFFQRVAGSVLGDPAVIAAIDSTLAELTEMLEESGPSLSKSLAGLIRGIVPFVSKLTPFLETAVDKVNEWTKKLEEFTESGNFSEMWDKLDFSSLVPDISGAIVKAIAGTAAAVIIGSAIGGVLSSGIAKLLSKVAFGSSGSGGLFGNMFKGVGKGVGGVLQGLAAGLAAFGKAGPAVVKGAAFLSAAIGILGVGIAGATWIMGQALPSFAEGLQAFESIDGDNLAKVGEGTMKLGAGLAAMAAGRIGELFGSVGEAIFEFFGGESNGPLEMLRQFSSIAEEVGPGITNLGQALGSFVPNLADMISAINDAEDINVDSLRQTLGSLISMDNISIPEVSINAGKVNTSEIERQIDEAIQAVDPERRTNQNVMEASIDADSTAAEQVEHLQAKVSRLWDTLARMEESGTSERVQARIQSQINSYNRMLTGVTRVNGQRLNSEAVTREMALINESAESVANANFTGVNDSAEQLRQATSSMVNALSPEDIARLESKRDALVRFIDRAENSGRGNLGSMDMVRSRLEQINQTLSQASQEQNGTADFTNIVTQTGMSQLPEMINNETTSLEAAITNYFRELGRLEDVKPISQSARVDMSPLRPETAIAQEDVTTPRQTAQYQRVDYGKPPMQIAQPEIRDDSGEQEEQSKQNPEISNTNVARRVPESEGEINTLIKDQNKMLGNLLIAMDTNNKRLKSLVRINEEKGA